MTPEEVRARRESLMAQWRQCSRSLQDTHDRPMRYQLQSEISRIRVRLAALDARS